MPGYCSTIFYPPLIRRRGRRPSHELIDISNRNHSPIHILNNDVLLNIFHLYRLAVPDEIEDENGMLNFNWGRRHCQWWYKLVHVCRQWRHIILESPSRLDLHLYCTVGVPVADMLAHSPPLPLILYYNTVIHKSTAKDESGILLALSHRDRVHYVGFWMLNPGKFVAVMDDQFPLLEHMYIDSLTEVDLPVTFQAPNLRHFRLWIPSLPIESPLLTSSPARLATLSLLGIPASAYLPPSCILTGLSLMAQLERLSITFDSLIPNHDVERQSREIPDMIPLPNLRRFAFQGTATYLDGLVLGSAPLPSASFFIQSSKNLSVRAVQVAFSASAIALYAIPWKRGNPLMFQIRCGHLSRQVASAVQFFGTLSPVLFAVEQVAFSYNERYQDSQWFNNVNRNQWRELVRPFTNVKVIHMKDGLTSKILRSLPSDDGEPLLPNIEEIGYSGGRKARNAITTFINERQVSGHPHLDAAAMELIGGSKYCSVSRLEAIARRRAAIATSSTLVKKRSRGATQQGGLEARVSSWEPAEIGKAAAVVRAAQRFPGLTNYTVRLDTQATLLLMGIQARVTFTNDILGKARAQEKLGMQTGEESEDSSNQ
ncbi:hypothetical protein BGW80DRAFT_1454915 [Lactifluus volemus]|nr:hypothetical protein BGW80DRAFT_1454915 [Lactifluus volemus]